MRGMNTDFPSIEDVRIRLQGLRDGEIYTVAKASGVPASTLWKIRCGATPNPGIETVRKFFSLLPLPAANDEQAPDTSSQQPAGQGVPAHG
jgi:predicted transcriptional regulator